MLHLRLSSMLRLSTWVWLGAFALAGCSSADSKSREAGGSGGSTGAGVGGGVGGAIGTGATAGDSSGAGGTIGNITFEDSGVVPSDAACNQFDLTFVPKTPTVYVLVDRSGSMFTKPATGTAAWEPLKAGVLKVIQQVQKDVRFGFGAFTGEIGQTCPMFDKVEAKFDNYEPIATLYNSLKAPTKGETPTMKVLQQVGEILKKDTTDGPKTILFVTDGEPDYCDDGNATCPVDSVVNRLQELNKAGINTVVFGLVSPVATVSEATLQAFANAGAGEPVQALVSGKPATQAKDIYDQCNGVTAWKEEATAAGRAMLEPLGTYAATSGAAHVFKPDPTQQDQLAKDLIAAVSTAKSCSFDLTGKVSVNTARLSEASVMIEGKVIPLDPTNGWTMPTPTRLDLVGNACTTWRQPENTHFTSNFPCDIIIILN